MCSFASYILENNEKILVVDKLCFMNYVRDDFSQLDIDVLVIVHK
jgi:hypothetical protein